MSPLRLLMLICTGLIWSLGAASVPLQAGIYNSAEPAVPLDDQLERFLDQLNRLRALGPPDALMQQVAGGAISEERKRYLARIEALRNKGHQTKLTADELANLGAYLYRVRTTQARIPYFQEAIEVLEQARREHPNHFAIMANLGTVYQMSGALDAAVSCLESAYAMAPPEWQKFERFHWMLVRRRFMERQRPGPVALDGLFDAAAAEPFRFIGPAGVWQIGLLNDGEREKLPGKSVAEAAKIVQQLLVWLPEDARLHWMLGELANAQGQLKAAAKAMTLAVDNFRFTHADLKLRRFTLEDAVVWSDVAQRVGTLQQQAEWVAQSWLGPMPVGMPGPAVPAELLAIASLCGKAKVNQEIPGLADFLGGHKKPGPPPALFSLDQIQWYWWVIGSVVILGLVWMQIREWLRKLGLLTNHQPKTPQA